ncbi:WecB/TagA/CpsF family glycosyltransferase [Marinobacter nauticus]|uniref:WecB/TagA/CpsF family glycosyltransferase n=1 Tax=Marinobacter nauticus TaxID=2743 RepID=UPI001C938507|nr:WecB/TagA/CpsF family glycosyltransferase [Marinobacter nauticus]MBY6219396.1 WecB/TagA/CpsF family glycosyltransferase [Marinobacter nauticus]
MERVYVARSPIDCVDLQNAVRKVIRKADSNNKFEYVVTPNVDHVVRNFHDQSLQNIYHSAIFSFCDSKVFLCLAKLKGYPIKSVVTGSDLTERVFEDVSKIERTITIIGGSEFEIDTIRKRYGISCLFHYNPPMGFASNNEEVDRCVEFVVGHPSDFVFLAVGSPQQEKLAHRIFMDARSKGLGLCIGASLRFLAGTEKRAPKFLSALGLEWLFRLINDPKRLWRRYFKDLYIFYLMAFRVRRYK